MKVLGVILTETLSFEMHVAQICCRARQSMYALRILTAHGLSGPVLYECGEGDNGGTPVVCCSGMVGLCQPKGEGNAPVCNEQVDPSAIPPK